jgi:hypothetical protein
MHLQFVKTMYLKTLLRYINIKWEKICSFVNMATDVLVLDIKLWRI